MKQIVNIINQVFEMEKKLQNGASAPLQRHIDRIKSELIDLGYEYHSPLNEKYDETRTDCEASIVGQARGKMVITEVIKPIVHQKEAGVNRIVQKGIVVVE